MNLLQKKLSDNSYYNFESILANSYNINEQPKEISMIQYSNNKRKKFVTSGDDVEISLILSPKNANEMRTYITNLTSGVYKYFSVKYGTIKESNFIVEIPPFIIDTYIKDNLILQDFEITLLLGEEE